MLTALLVMTSLKTGTVRLHLTDSHNKPIARHQVWLTPTNSTKLVRPFGVQWVIPGGSYHGVTNQSGDVAISGVPMRKAMAVVTKFGPRFDPFVAKNGNPSGSSLDVMKFEGAVYAGKKASIMLADDREICGTVSDGEGKPMAGVEVVLSDTGFGHMGGYPGTTLDLQRTDARGFYRFARLPNCSFSFYALGPKGTAVQAQMDKGPLELLSTDDMGTSASAMGSKAKTICNFHIVRTATVTAVFKGTPTEFAGWTAWMAAGSSDLGGQELDYRPDSAQITREALPGEITIWISRDRGRIAYVAQKITVKPGETRTLEISMADVLKRKQRH